MATTNTHDPATMHVTVMKTVSSNMTEVDAGQFLSERNAERVSALAPTVVYLVLVMVLGLLGNGIVYRVYHRRFKAGSSVRTYVMALCVCDILTSVLSVTLELLEIGYYVTYRSAWACRLSRGVKSVLTFLVAAILVAVALAQHRKICGPVFRWKPVAVNSRQSLAVCVIFSVIVTLPYVIIVGPQTVHFPQVNVTGAKCSVADAYVGSSTHKISIVIMALTFIACLVIMSVAYARIALRLWQHKSENEAAAAAFKAAKRSTRRRATQSGIITNLRQPNRQPNLDGTTDRIEADPFSLTVELNRAPSLQTGERCLCVPQDTNQSETRPTRPISAPPDLCWDHTFQSRAASCSSALNLNCSMDISYYLDVSTDGIGLPEPSETSIDDSHEAEMLVDKEVERTTTAAATTAVPNTCSSTSGSSKTLEDKGSETKPNTPDSSKTLELTDPEAKPNTSDSSKTLELTDPEAKPNTSDSSKTLELTDPEAKPNTSDSSKTLELTDPEAKPNTSDSSKTLELTDPDAKPNTSDSSKTLELTDPEAKPNTSDISKTLEHTETTLKTSDSTTATINTCLPTSDSCGDDSDSRGMSADGSGLPNVKQTALEDSQDAGTPAHQDMETTSATPSAAATTPTSSLCTVDIMYSRGMSTDGNGSPTASDMTLGEDRDTSTLMNGNRQSERVTTTTIPTIVITCCSTTDITDATKATTAVLVPTFAITTTSNSETTPSENQDTSTSIHENTKSKAATTTATIIPAITITCCSTTDISDATTTDFVPTLATTTTRSKAIADPSTIATPDTPSTAVSTTSKLWKNIQGHPPFLTLPRRTPRDKNASAQRRTEEAVRLSRLGSAKPIPTRTTLRLFVMTVVCVAVNYLPYLIIGSLRKYEDRLQQVLGVNTYQILYRSYFVHAAVIPIIYVCFSVRFRRECRRLFLRASRKLGSSRQRS